MAIVFAFFSAAFGGLQPVLLKKSAEMAKPTMVTFLKSTSSFFILFAFISLYRPGWYKNLSLNVCLLVALTSFIGPVAAWYFYVRAMKSLDITIVHPLVNSYPAISILLDLLFFRVIPSFLSILGFLLILLGLHNLRQSDKKRKTGERFAILYAMITAFLWGINSFLFKIVLFYVSPITMTTLRVFFSMLFLLFFNLIAFKKDILCQFEKIHIKEVILAGIAGDFLSMFFFFLAIKHGALYIVLPISATSPFMSALYARLFFKEKMDNLRTKGIIFIVTGGVLVGLGKI